MNSWIAKAVNATFGDWENLFAPGSYNMVKLVSGHDVARKAAYTLLNPTKAGLVKLPAHWEGVTSWSMKYGKVEVVERPSGFFGRRFPKRATLLIVRPKAMMAGLDDLTARERLRREVRERACEFARRFREEGGRFMGMTRVRRQPRHSSPHTRAPRRGIRPTVAAANVDLRKEALRRRQVFLERYQHARVEWERGNRGVVFPLGTYLMHERFGVSVAKK